MTERENRASPAAGTQAGHQSAPFDENRRKKRKRRQLLVVWTWIGRILLFPALLVYLELLLHLFMRMDLEYLPVYLVFGLSAGYLFSTLTLSCSARVNRFLTGASVLLLSLLYGVELVAKAILQTYYPLSILRTASENRLTDYTGLIAEQVLSLIPVLLLLLLPCGLVLFLLGRLKNRVMGPDLRLSGMTLATAILLHLLGLGVLQLPWKGDLTPQELYHMDSSIDDQVEQLGLWTMLRLDIKHMIVPPENTPDDDFSALESLEALEEDTPQEENTPAEESPTEDLPVEETAPMEGDASDGAPDSGAPPDEETGQETEELPDAQALDTSPNIMDVDLEALAQETDNEDIAWLANYFSSVSPTDKNEYTGMFEGYNVIQFVLEGFSGYAIDPELTPTLYRLSNEGFVFRNYYTALHFTSTSNGECQTLLGLYPKNGNPITLKHTGELGTNCYFSLAQQLGRAGYQVLGYHNNQDMYGRNASHTNLGYDWRYYTNGLTCEENAAGTDRLWPQRDRYMVEVSVDDYINSPDPFHVYYLTVSGHTNYEWNRVARQYRDLVSGLPYSEKTQAYVAAAAIEADRALEYLLERLEEAGKLESTLIVVTGDHIPYADVDVLEELSGRDFGASENLVSINESTIDFDVYRSSLILWSASMEEPVEVDKVCCQVDILPTVSNLLGLEYDSRMLAGRDILSDSEGLVVFSSRCWKTDRGFYNRFTQTFTPASGVTMTEEEQETYVNAMKQLVSCQLESTSLIVENDFYDVVFGARAVQP